MRSLPHLLICCLLSSSALAFQFSFSVPFFKSSQAILDEQQDNGGPPRIAIVGAGAAGSSAAFWIGKARERFGIDVEVDVYERSDYVGGRSTTVYPYGDTNLPPVELGASIFVEANKNLMRASKEFNLTLAKFEDDDSDTGIWDGQNFIVVMKSGGFFKSWWSTLKVLWRYGYTAPTQTRTFVQNMVKQFGRLYVTESPRWDDIADLAARFEWTALANHTTAEYLDSKGVSPKFSREVVEAATRVNYGQNVDEIHALEGAASMAATGASGVATGNYKIFEQFIERSGATLHLGTTVKEIKRKAPSSSLWSVVTTSGSTKTYKGVILASPFHFSHITLPTDLADLIPEQPYVHLHVTLLATRSPHASAEYFGLGEKEEVPQTVLTTYEGVRKGGKEPEFNSLSYHGVINRTRAAEGEGEEAVEEEEVKEYVVKIFSKETVSDEWLERIFGHVGWVYRKEWDAYPKLPPASVFPPVKLDQGLYYVNSFEPFISTMETETIASRNVVDLLLHEEFGSGICGSLLSSVGSEEAYGAGDEKGGEEFVLGWDC
ncbi:hypothetical protein SERLA73DRAFT_165743 [Serpula lacrymans var. lacrymans S7.3]|uniref:Prenylcysteine lyase domain-containing protein n=1 Tax=Serpula lacrymans var. lacrymans (strain S7.3) TaxID=936435 RepID=F8PMG4_SERL3|nr:hypothetical protein SERLA73DRAFT_165743 [Serpula lacrymans var. lacrymans S7.3]